MLVGESEISVDDPRAEDVRALLARHLAFANEHSPPRTSTHSTSTVSSVLLSRSTASASTVNSLELARSNDLIDNTRS
jgi:hypothetical protein